MTTVIHVILVLVLALVLPASSVWADEYFNSTECPHTGGVPANSNWLLCDNWSDGTHIAVNQQGHVDNDGWWLTSIRTIPGGAACGSLGPAGTDCVQRNVLVLDSDGSGSNAYPSTHGWYQGQTLSGYRMRFYFIFRPGWVFRDSQKFLSGQDQAHSPGIVHFGLGRNLDVMELCPVESCNNLNGPYLQQNQGNNIVLTSGTWYYMELRFILNTPGVSNGTFQMWINDCGASGVCTGVPVLRESRTDVLYRGASETRPFGGIFMDIWGNPSDGGTLDIANLIVAKDEQGLIGFIGGSSGPKGGLSGSIKGVGGIRVQ